MSAIGSVIISARPPSARCAFPCLASRALPPSARPLPRRLRDAGDLPGVGQLPEADTTEAEPAVHGTRAATPATTRVGPGPELGPAIRLVDQCLLRHETPMQRPRRPRALPRREIPGPATGRDL